jgi:hypothetical protein
LLSARLAAIFRAMAEATLPPLNPPPLAEEIHRIMEAPKTRAPAA